MESDGNVLSESVSTNMSMFQSPMTASVGTFVDRMQREAMEGVDTGSALRQNTTQPRFDVNDSDLPMQTSMSSVHSLSYRESPVVSVTPSSKGLDDRVVALVGSAALSTAGKVHPLTHLPRRTHTHTHRHTRTHTHRHTPSSSYSQVYSLASI